MLELVGQRGCGYVLMHIEGPPRVDREPPGHTDPVAYLIGWFAERLESALARGIHEEQIALDPGFDFDLSVDDDARILAGLGELRRRRPRRWPPEQAPRSCGCTTRRRSTRCGSPRRSRIRRLRTAGRRSRAIR